MEVLDGWITGVFLGSSRHEIIGSKCREEETPNKLLCHSHQIYKYYVGFGGSKDRASEIRSGCCIRRFCAMYMD